MLGPGPKCQDCDNKKSPPVGMVYWPTDEDDYICIVCLRERFRSLESQLEAMRENEKKILISISTGEAKLGRMIERALKAEAALETLQAENESLRLAIKAMQAAHGGG